MSRATQLPTTETRVLDARAATRVLARAMVEHVPIQIEARVQGLDQAWSGAVAGGGDDTLILDISPGQWPLDGLEDVETVQCGLTILDMEYRFSTWLAKDACRLDASVVAILVPTTLCVEERRRSPRRSLVEASEVKLTRIGAGQPSRFTGRLFNVSADGLACRVERKDIAGLGIGDLLVTAFSAGTPPTTVELSARIVNVTTGSDPSRVVLGMAFAEEEDGNEDRANLASALTKHATKG